MVDDNDQVRRLLSATLADAGIEAADGREALRLVDQHQPDVVVLVWVMPDGGLPLA